MKLGAHIRGARRAKKWTQLRLAEAVGVSVQAISQWERDETTPGFERLMEISQHLDMSFVWAALGDGISGAPVPKISAVQAKYQKAPILHQHDLKSSVDHIKEYFGASAKNHVMLTGSAIGEYFAFTLNYDALELGFRRGDMLVFDTGVSPSPGDWVCAKVHDVEQILFAKYAEAMESGTQKKLGMISKLNDANKYIILSSDSGDKIIATMIERRSLR